ncbi:type II toxin-antitoxin system mRNA interferase toxin, RelE/StbE family [Bdellovibrio sp. HCB185ZH]|uniref:type II toxin-antitoxin system mRNA interferase toxin, RelE/StbE family n=1 Tax=Bdellovibrio sp. HCB185ZH TaxID=3394235 RepID=UPI0039A42054
MIHKVVLSKTAKKDLLLVPIFIRHKLDEWILSVELVGLENVRKIPGFHDEPLKGKRTGERSIRLNRSYQAIYRITGESVAFVQIEEVNKHAY